MISPKDLDEAVASIIAARTNRQALRRLPPGGAALSLDDAYSVQETFVRECKLPVVGYKIGCASKDSQALVGAAGPFAARIFAPTRFDSPAEISAREFFTLGVEAEFAFTMRAALPPRRVSYARAEVARVVASVTPVIELCDTRLENWKTARIEEIIADNGFHGGLVVGTAVRLGKPRPGRTRSRALDRRRGARTRRERRHARPSDRRPCLDRQRTFAPRLRSWRG